MDSRWPTTPETFRDVAEKSMIPEAHKLSLRILSMLERRGCKHLKPGTLEKAHTLWEEDSRCCLRVINYTPMTIDELKDNTQPGNRHWRAAPHTGKYESLFFFVASSWSYQYTQTYTHCFLPYRLQLSYFTLPACRRGRVGVSSEPSKCCGGRY